MREAGPFDGLALGHHGVSEYLDPLGHVNNAAISTYFESARVALFSDAGNSPVSGPLSVVIASIGMYSALAIFIVSLVLAIIALLVTALLVVGTRESATVNAAALLGLAPHSVHAVAEGDPAERR